jgi:hypothetical protein
MIPPVVAASPREVPAMIVLVVMIAPTTVGVELSGPTMMPAPTRDRCHDGRYLLRMDAKDQE